jgi:predicted transcriptional regulator
MNVSELVSALGLAVVSDLHDTAITGAYAADLLSDVVGNAQAGNVLITVQVHRNVVAVAGLVGLAAVIITHGRVPEPDVLAAARENTVTVLTTAESSFTVAGRLYALGLRSA